MTIAELIECLVQINKDRGVINGKHPKGWEDRLWIIEERLKTEGLVLIDTDDAGLCVTLKEWV